MARSSVCLRTVGTVLPLQPKQITEIKEFLMTARRPDAKCTWRAAGVQARACQNCIILPGLPDGDALFSLGCSRQD